MLLVGWLYFEEQGFGGNSGESFPRDNGDQTQAIWRILVYTACNG